MHSPEGQFRIHSNGRVRSIVLPGGQGGLSRDWVALTRFSEADPHASGPEIYLREGADRRPADLSVALDVGIAPDADVEIRKITLVNGSDRAREIELTTYMEIALNHPLGDAGHPAFSKLFVQTSVTAGSPALLARRRPRGMNESWPWLAQALIGGKDLSWETNRVTFLGRGRGTDDPAAMDRPGALSGETGNVLDPVMAWRCTVALGPNESRDVWLVTAVADDAKAARSLIASCDAATLPDKAKAARGKLEISSEDADRYEAMAGVILLSRRDRVVPESPAGSEVLHRYPLSWEEIRVIAAGTANSEGTRDLFSAVPYWRSFGLRTKLYLMDSGAVPIDGPLPEGTEIVDPASMTPEELAWWLASAQWVGGEETGSAPGLPERPVAEISTPTDSPAPDAGTLRHFNGYGGFSPDGREYVISLPLENGRLKLPPMPWINVLANPRFGCIVSERGAGYTWARNSQANRLTPWSNDPVRDPHGEALYLRDMESGALSSPVPGPCPPRCGYQVRHGFGRSVFLSELDGISREVEFLVPPDDPVKLVAVRLRNDSGRSRTLAFASYQKLVIGSSPDRHHATLAWTDDDGVQHAVNPRAGDFAGGRAFSAVALHGAAVTDRKYHNSSAAFLGEGGTADPAGNEATRGFGRDACFSSTTTFTLEPGAEVEVLVILGEAMSHAEETKLLETYLAPGAAAAAWKASDDFWQDMLGGVQIETPMPEVDLMVNGWLLYQNLACRIWGRSAFYQSGGAYGFRDQLQDSSALAALHPELMREQILLHAAQQFPEGDVTHWWHPEPMGRGMRTKFSDDLLWLPYLTDHYLATTGDVGILDEKQPFIEGPLLGEDEDEEYMKPEISPRYASVFEHCCLAIDKSLTTGAHGLPLMGIGDWNDGMSRIGREGRGESVWMGFFLITILKRWIPLCEERGETTRAEVYANYLNDLLAAVNDAGWDAEWYRRAYYDDGTPLGTRDGDECKIDALAQAWAVISGAAPPDRAASSLDALERELTDAEAGIIRLLHPPFVNTPHDPGYIKGYVAGVRENGGQYTHAACWVVRAMAEAGRRDGAAEWLKKIGPVWHTRDEQAVATYQTEPYAVAADIYGADPHVGRGGWTWYTGSAGWMFRVAVESVLGLRLENGDTLVLDPRVPDSWQGFTIQYRPPSGRGSYRIEVTVPAGNAAAVAALAVDGIEVAIVDGVARWPLIDDDAAHTVVVTLGA